MIFLLLFLSPFLFGVLNLVFAARKLQVWNLLFSGGYCLGLLSLFSKDPQQMMAKLPASLSFVSEFFLVATFVEYFLILLCASVMFLILLRNYKSPEPKPAQTIAAAQKATAAPAQKATAAPAQELKNGTKESPPFLAALFFSWSALVALFSTQNALLLYIFWELSVLPIFFCILFSAKRAAQVQVALRFFLYTFFSSMFLLTGFLYLYWVHPDMTAVSSLQNFQMTAFLRVIDLELLQRHQLQFLFVWMIFAIGVKIPFLPFHSWQPETYALANLPTLQFTAALLGKMGVFLLLRWFVLLFAPIWDWALLYVFYPAATLTLVLGYLMAWREANLMRSLAYYSMAHTALIFLAVVIPDPNAKVGGIFLIFIHGLLMVGLFAVADCLRRYQQSENLEERNIRKINPALFYYALALTMAAIGLPLTAVFAGEFLVYVAVYRDFPIMVLPVLSGTVLGAVVLLRMMRLAMWGADFEMEIEMSKKSNWKPDYKRKWLGENRWNEQLFFILLIFLLWTLGIFPEILLEPIRQAIG